MKSILLATLISFSAHANQCGEYKRVFGIVDLTKKTWETTRVETDLKKICDSFFSTPDSNLSIHLTKGKNSFVIKLHRPLEGHFDNLKDGKLSGGKYAIEFMSIDSLMPSWSDGSEITVKDISGKTILAKGKI